MAKPAANVAVVAVVAADAVALDRVASNNNIRTVPPVRCR
jgi:hypothetical protein